MVEIVKLKKLFNFKIYCRQSISKVHQNIKSFTKANLNMKLKHLIKVKRISFLCG